MSFVVFGGTTVTGYVAADLAEYILKANPYKAEFPPAGVWKEAYPPPVVTIRQTNETHDELFALDSSGIEHEQTPGEWKFKYVDHYVSRAIRIPYMYYRKSDVDATQAVLIRDYFLIGFEGGHGY